MKNIKAYFNSRKGFQRIELFSEEIDNIIEQMDSSVDSKMDIVRSVKTIAARMNGYGGTFGTLVTFEFNLNTICKKFNRSIDDILDYFEANGLSIQDINRYAQEWHEDHNVWYNQAIETISNGGGFERYYLENFNSTHLFCESLKLTMKEVMKISSATGSKSRVIEPLRRRVIAKRLLDKISEFGSFDAFVRDRGYDSISMARYLGLTPYQWEKSYCRLFGIDINYASRLELRDREAPYIERPGHKIPHLPKKDYETEIAMFKALKTFIDRVGGIKVFVEALNYDVDVICDHLHILKSQWNNMILLIPSYTKAIFEINIKHAKKGIRVDALHFLKPEDIRYIKYLNQFIDRDVFVNRVVDYVKEGDLATMGVAEFNDELVSALPNSLPQYDVTKVMHVICEKHGYKRESVIEESLVDYLSDILYGVESDEDITKRLNETMISVDRLFTFCNTPESTIPNVFKGIVRYSGESKEELSRYLLKVLSNGVFARGRSKVAPHKSDLVTIMKAMYGVK